MEYLNKYMVYPDSPVNVYYFAYFEKIIKKVDMTSHDYFLQGDINMDLMRV